jgi:hypothetical protein
MCTHWVTHADKLDPHTSSSNSHFLFTECESHRSSRDNAAKIVSDNSLYFRGGERGKCLGISIKKTKETLANYKSEVAWCVACISNLIERQTLSHVFWLLRHGHGQGSRYLKRAHSDIVALIPALVLILAPEDMLRHRR